MLTDNASLRKIQIIPLRDVPEKKHQYDALRNRSLIIAFRLRAVVGWFGLFGQRQSVAVAPLPVRRFQ
jgi:hypothetical protein